jgi:hypothetical protein
MRPAFFFSTKYGFSEPFPLYAGNGFVFLIVASFFTEFLPEL